MKTIVNHFTELSKIPRCSGHEEKVREFLLSWAAAQGFATSVDNAGNLLVAVPASTGNEQSPAIVLQGHMDMVCEKNHNIQHDFTTDPIKLHVDGEWLHAVGTTLGADNGAGLALAMSLAEDQNLGHPPLELLCTVDEESGLTGALSLAENFFSGKILINVDSEDEGVFTIGCAGGRETTIIFPLQFEDISPTDQHCELKIGGLQGGHSGVNIGERRGNANVLLARLLVQLRRTIAIRLTSLAGGNAHNAIAREASASFCIDRTEVARLTEFVSKLQESLRQEYANEPQLTVSLQTAQEVARRAFTKESNDRLIDLLITIPDGVMSMSREVAGLVETSVNFATMRQKGDNLHLLLSLRSDKPYGIEQQSDRIVSLARLTGARVTSGNGYPGWQPNLNSDLLARAKRIYRELFDGEPVIEIIHAGLECGIIGTKYEGMDMISIGPTIKNPHSPQEKLHLPSLEKVYRFTAALLESYCGN